MRSQKAHTANSAKVEQTLDETCTLPRSLLVMAESFWWRGDNIKCGHHAQTRVLMQEPSMGLHAHREGPEQSRCEWLSSFSLESEECWLLPTLHSQAQGLNAFSCACLLARKLLLRLLQLLLQLCCMANNPTR